MASGGRAFIDIEIVGDDAGVLQMLKRLDTCFSAQGMTQFLGGDVAPYLQRRARGRFAGEGDDVAGSWAPLRPATRRIRAHGIQSGMWAGISESHPINVRSGDMMDYITKSNGDVTAGASLSTLHFPSRRVPTRRGLQQKIRRAQLGDTRTRKRPVLGVNDRDLAFVVQRLAFFIKRGPK